MRHSTNPDGQQPVPFLPAHFGNGYEVAKSRHLFQDFIDATALIAIDEKTICVQSSGFDRVRPDVRRLFFCAGTQRQRFQGV